MKPKKQKPVPAPDHRFAYLFLLAGIVFLLWMLTQPRPGVREKVLKPLFAPVAEAPAGVPDRIRVATYNVEHFSDGRGDEPERTPALVAEQARLAAAVIAEASPDILFLQEVENAAVVELLNDQFLEPYPYAYITTLRYSSGKKDKLNLAMLSRIPPRRVRQISFSRLDYGSANPARGLLAASFNTGPGQRLLAYNIHLKSNFGEAHRNQARRSIALSLLAADAAAEKSKAFPNQMDVLVLGDTNVDPENEQFAADESLYPLAGGFDDLWLGRPIEERVTIPMRQGEDPEMVFEDACFDRIFASRSFRNGPWRAGAPESLKKSVATHNNQLLPGMDGNASDHYLVWVDLEPRPVAPAVE